MKSNRQIGLDGKIFVSTAMHRGKFFVFMLMIYGILTAAADILKLTGASGVAMNPFTTTLLIYDFIASLLLVVVVFYAYFLECGADVPVIKEKPLMLFGFFRLGYHLLLSYYLCYRMLYCAVNRDSVSTSVCIFYAAYLLLEVLLILANCYIFNIITRNLIRRSYEKSFHRLAIAGFVVQALLPISYIVARFLMDDIGDDYFTTAVCDLIRLLFAPMMLTSVWFLFLHGVGQVHDVYSEVDTALKGKQYQITYTSETFGSGKNKTAPATATVLPAGAAAAAAITAGAAAGKTSQKQVSAPQQPEIKEEPSAIGPDPKAVVETIAAEISESDKKTESEAAEEQSEAKTETESKNDSEKETKTENSSEAENNEDSSDEEASNNNDDEPTDDEIVASFAAEARKAAAKTAAQNNAKKQAQKKAQQKKAQQQARQKAQQQVPLQPALPVQEFDPYPAASVPRQKAGSKPAQQNGQRPAQQNGQRPAQQNGQRPAQQNGQRPAQQNGQRPAQQNGQRPAQQNGQRSAQQNGQRPAQQNGQRPAQQNGQRSAQQNGRNANNHR